MLEFGKKVYGEYKISSMPFTNKSDAYDEIRISWRGHPNVTTYFSKKDGKWYIVTK